MDGEAGPEASLYKCTLGVCSEISPCNYTQWVCLFGCFCFFGAARKTRLNEISIYFELFFFVCFFVVGGEWKATVAVNVSLEQGTSGFGNALMHRSTN